MVGGEGPQAEQKAGGTARPARGAEALSALEGQEEPALGGRRKPCQPPAARRASLPIPGWGSRVGDGDTLALHHVDAVRQDGQQQVGNAVVCGTGEEGLVVVCGSLKARSDF